MSSIIYTTTKWSKYILIAFFFAILLLMAANEFFQIPHHQAVPSHLENPIEEEFLSRVESIEITNSLGRYQLLKKQGTWHMLRPRALQARGDLIHRILHSLSQLKVHRIYKKDKINIQNFSLHKPSLHIKLTSVGKSQNLTFGFLNSIDESTYITDDDSPLIYQVKAMKIAVHALNLNALIDSNIFKFAENKIQRIQVKKYPFRRNSVRLNLIRKGSSWKGSNQEKLDEQRTKQWLDKLLSQKADIILDKRSQNLEEKISEEMNRPSYILSVQGSEGQEATYKISRPLSSLENIKLGNKKFILITSSLKGVPPIIANQSLLELFKMKASRLRIPSPQKIFY